TVARHARRSGDEEGKGHRGPCRSRQNACDAPGTGVPLGGPKEAVHTAANARAGETFHGVGRHQPCPPAGTFLGRTARLPGPKWGPPCACPGLPCGPGCPAGPGRPVRGRQRPSGPGPAWEPGRGDEGRPGIMNCSRCQRENRAGARFCEQCGGPVARGCGGGRGGRAPAAAMFSRGRRPRAAGSGSPARFASPDGYTPSHLAEKILTSKNALEGERKQVTVLFADMKSSMELMVDRDPEEARTLLDPVLERMMEAVHRY